MGHLGEPPFVSCFLCCGDGSLCCTFLGLGATSRVPLLTRSAGSCVESCVGVGMPKRSAGGFHCFPMSLEQMNVRKGVQEGTLLVIVVSTLSPCVRAADREERVRDGTLSVSVVATLSPCV